MNSPYREEKAQVSGNELKYFLRNKRVSLFMKYYIEESITSLGEVLDAKLSSPAKKDIQNLDEI